MFGSRLPVLVFAALLLVGGCAERHGRAGEEHEDAAVEPDSPSSEVDAGAPEADAAASADGSSATGVDATPDSTLDADSDSSAPLDAWMDAAPDTGMLDADSSQPMGDAGRDAEVPPQSPTAMYVVETYSGGLNHLIIQKQDPARGYCVFVRIAQPSTSGGRYAIDLPQSWGLVTIIGVERGSCGLSSSGPPAPTHSPVTGEGRVAFQQESMFGRVCSLDIDVLLTFEADAGSVPPVEHLFATNVAVPCG